MDPFFKMQKLKVNKKKKFSNECSQDAAPDFFSAVVNNVPWLEESQLVSPGLLILHG